MAVMGVPTEDEMQQAIGEYLRRSGGFVPDVDVSDLSEATGAGSHHATLFLSFVRSRESSNADALREALGRVQDGFASGDILSGLLSDVQVAEDVPGIFNEERERVVLAAHLSFVRRG
jgi:hypothetical protein